MLRRKVILSVLGCLAATTALAAPAVVQAAKGEEGGWSQSAFVKLITGHASHFKILCADLNVTDEQKAKIKEIVAPYKPEIAKAAKGVLEKRTALHDAVLAKDANEQVIRNAAEDLGKSIGDAAVLASKVVAQIKPTLTDEQREKIKKFRVTSQEATNEFFADAVASQ